MAYCSDGEAFFQSCSSCRINYREREKDWKILETVADLQFQVQGWEIDKFGINWNLILPILRFWIIGIEPRSWKIHIVKCFFFLIVNRQVKNFKIQNLEISNDTERMMISSTHFSFNVQLEKLYPTFSELSSRKSHKGTFMNFVSDYAALSD